MSVIVKTSLGRTDCDGHTWEEKIVHGNFFGIYRDEYYLPVE